MRRISALSVALLIAVPAVAKNPTVVGRATYTNNPIFSSAMPANVVMSRLDRSDAKEDGYHGSFQVSGLYGQTTDKQAIRDYFLPFSGKSSLIAGEVGSTAYQVAGGLPGVDLVANYFGVLTAAVDSVADLDTCDFQSTLSFSPKQTVAGVGLQWQQRFGKCKNWWFKVNAPVLYVKNDLGMTEDVTDVGAGSVQTSSGAVANMTDAFKQSTLNYGKIDGARHKWGVADLEAMVGYDFIDEDVYQLGGYLGVVAPTSNKPNSSYLWMPVVGNNKHAGVMLGSSGRAVWKEGDNYSLSAVCDADARYLFQNTQYRTFDLLDRGPWSRYIWLVKKDATFSGSNFIQYGTNTFLGPNILTQEAKVRPHGAFTVNTALNYHRVNGLQAELGVNVYARQSEEVELKNAFTNSDNYMIPDTDTALDTGTASYSAPATINNASLGVSDQDYDNDPFALTLTQAMLDLNSAAAPAVIQNTFYGHVGMNWDKWKYPGFAGVGGAYTVNADNAGFDHWVVWAKLGLSF